MRNKRLLILGATGMLGHTLFEQLPGLNDFDVHATARSIEGLPGVFPPRLVERIKGGVDADNANYRKKRSSYINCSPMRKDEIQY
jgi:dTDP-4-dehydrorhamnose reductase